MKVVKVVEIIKNYVKRINLFFLLSNFDSTFCQSISTTYAEIVNERETKCRIFGQFKKISIPNSGPAPPWDKLVFENTCFHSIYSGLTQFINDRLTMLRNALDCPRFDREIIDISRFGPIHDTFGRHQMLRRNGFPRCN